MANVDRPNGFRPVKSLIGAPWTSLVRKYPAVSGRSATNNSGDIYIGDCVTLSAGNVVPMTTLGGAVLGVVVAVGTSNSETALNTENVARYYDPDNLSKRYLAYDEDGWVGVVPAEACLFSVQSAIANCVIGATYDLLISTTGARGNRTTGNSIQEITTAATGNDVAVIEHYESPDNDTSLVDARYIVKFTTHSNAIN